MNILTDPIAQEKFSFLLDIFILPYSRMTNNDRIVDWMEPCIKFSWDNINNMRNMGPYDFINNVKQ